MSILVSRVSLDDYQLKVRNLLRNSAYRDQITQLEKGSFVYPELDLKLTVQPFQQEGTPYKWQPKQIPEQPKPAKQPMIIKVLNWLTNNKQPEPIQQPTANNSEETGEEEDNENSQADGLMTLENEDILFPEEF